MKILGIVLGAAAIIMAGFTLRGNLSRRVALLDKLILEMEVLKKGVLIYKKPIGEILKGLTLPPFKEKGELNEIAFTEALECVERIKACTLGSEEAIIGEGMRKIHAYRKEAEKDLHEKGLMYIKLSVCIALLFVVIVI